jgi:succinate dehydrogenase / fumarate reductase flavoprotein subunit
MKHITEYHDLIIIGGGGAGLMAANEATKLGLKTLCVSKVFPTRSHTAAAQGGINAALGNQTEDDWRWHMYDTIKSGDYLADQDSVEFMCRNAAQAICDLEKQGVVFDRFKNGKIYQRPYGGQAQDFGKGDLAYRACASADRTGHTILNTLYQNSLKLGCKFSSEYFALDLLMQDGQCCGVLVWDMESGKVLILRSKTLIIATGGFGQIYKTNTSSSICTGDGNAMALRAGAALHDMEFVQFHPTGIYGNGLLITEAARGEGAYLLNGKGERFMEKYAPKYKELASRDIIARAIAQEIKEGRGCGPKADHIYLDLRHLNKSDIMEKLPTVFSVAKDFARVDVSKEPIPILPSAHYTMGGVAVNYNSEALDGKGKVIEGLMAIGEAACISVHGANRLGCNSLLDIIVFGKAAAQRAAEHGSDNHISFDEAYSDQKIADLQKLLKQKGCEKIHDLREQLQSLMDSYVGVFRNAEDLTIAGREVAKLKGKLSKASINDESLIWNNNLLEYLELQNLVLQAEAVIISAQNRKESRGAHYRDDFPKRNDKKYLHHSVVNLSNDKITHSTKKVRQQALSPELSIIVKERSY